MPLELPELLARYKKDPAAARADLEQLVKENISKDPREIASALMMIIEARELDMLKNILAIANAEDYKQTNNAAYHTLYLLIAKWESCWNPPY